MRHPAVVVCAFVIGILVLGLPFLGKIEVPVLLLAAGRFHPLVLHFPIVLIILALALEVAARLKLLPIAGKLQAAILASSAATALIAIVAGYFLFAGGEYSGDLMEQHFWGAAVSGAAVFFTFGLYILSRKMKAADPFYVGLLVLTNISIAFTGHIGGSITHGKNYLTEYAPLLFASEVEESKPVSEMLVYDDMIQPIFQAKCANCHNPLRSKGGLVTTSLAGIARGGNSGLVLIAPGDTAASELFRRVTLPADHDDAMPPLGQSPMTEGEVQVLAHWISSGADASQKASVLQGSPQIGEVVDKLLPDLARYRRKGQIARLRQQKLSEELRVVAQQVNVTIEEDSLEPGFFGLRVKFPPAPFTNDQFRELAPYNDHFSKLSLVSSGISDAGLYHISRMPNVKRLYLQKTDIDGSGFVYLQQLPNLEVLNLSFTKVDDKAAIDLLRFPALKQVYLFGTGTSVQVIEALRKSKPELKILMEEGPYF